MKELSGGIYKDFLPFRRLIYKVKLPMVLSKRSLIHSNSFQQKNLMMLEAIAIPINMFRSKQNCPAAETERYFETCYNL